ncbi:MAG TPA: cupin domain-containing protein [Bacteroidales bacterium]|nr:cupin domain-containing protein [Bacteroidales bacterium]
MMSTAEFWIENLQLQPHPEGGYFREIYRSLEYIGTDLIHIRYDSGRCFATSIYFLLKSSQISAFHRLKSDEIWHFYEGSSITVYMIDEEGRLTENILGRHVPDHEQLQLVIPHGSWFAAEIKHPGSFSLVGCTVAPGFDFKDFELAEKSSLMKSFPQHSELIGKMCVR